MCRNKAVYLPLSILNFIWYILTICVIILKLAGGQACPETTEKYIFIKICFSVVSEAPACSRNLSIFPERKGEEYV